MSEGLPEPISLWDFCAGLDDLDTDEPHISFDPDELLRQLQNSNENHEDLSLPSLDVQRGVEASPASELPEDKDIMAELSTYRESFTRSTSSESEVLTLSPVGPRSLPMPELPMPESHSLPIFTNRTDIASVTIADGAVQQVSLRDGSAGLIAQLPPMFRTKLDCPRDGGCAINTVKSLPGGSSCKGRDAIGSKHKFSCLCGLKWQENNWRERERLTKLGEADTRCIQYLPTSTPKRKQSTGSVGAKAKK